MSTQLQPGGCCPPSCNETLNVSVPGPAGANGTDGTDGSAGRNAYGLLTAPFVQPAVDATVIAIVDSSTWAAIYMDVFQESGGYYQVVAIPDATHITLKNRGYDANVAPGSVIPSGSRITPAGEKGETGDVDTNGALMQSENLNDLDNKDTALNNLGADDVGIAILRLTNPNLIRFLQVNADNSASLLSAAAFKTALSLTPGTNIQAWDALLQELSALGTAADKIFYTTGVGQTLAETALTTLARTLLAQSTASDMRSTLGNVLPRYGVLATKAGAAMDVATDYSMAVEATKYRVDKICVIGLSGDVSAATAAVFTLPAGAGISLANDQALTGVTGATKYKDMTLTGTVGTDLFTAATLYFKTASLSGAGTTASVFVLGWVLQ